MHEIITVTLAKRAFEIKALDLDALSALYETMAAHTADSNPVRHNARIVAAALKQDHPAESIGETLRPTMPELSAAARAILQLSGLIPAEDTPSGEAQAP